MEYPESLIPHCLEEFDSLLTSWNAMHPAVILRRCGDHDKNNHPVINGYQVQAWLHFHPGCLGTESGQHPTLTASMDRADSYQPTPLVALDLEHQVPVPAGYKLLKDSTAAERKLQGPGSMYYNTCANCLRMFEGPKHSHICNVCRTPD